MFRDKIECWLEGVQQMNSNIMIYAYTQFFSGVCVCLCVRLDFLIWKGSMNT